MKKIYVKTPHVNNILKSMHWMGELHGELKCLYFFLFYLHYVYYIILNYDEKFK